MSVLASFFFEKNKSFRVDLRINFIMMGGDFVLSFFQKGRIWVIFMSFLCSLSFSLRFVLSLTMISSRMLCSYCFVQYCCCEKQCNL